MTQKRLEGGQTLDVSATLDEIPIYVRAGTILPLGPIVQNTDQLPGGPLELQIYPGKDSTFTLVEDDGETTSYLRGDLRRTIFKWEDASRKLSWSSEGNYTGSSCYKDLTLSLYDSEHRTDKKELKVTLSSSGLVNL